MGLIYVPRARAGGDIMPPLRGLRKRGFLALRGRRPTSKLRTARAANAVADGKSAVRSMVLRTVLFASEAASLEGTACCSHGRKPVDAISITDREPRRGERCSRRRPSCRPFGIARMGLISVPRARARGYIMSPLRGWRTRWFLALRGRRPTSTLRTARAANAVADGKYAVRSVVIRTVLFAVRGN